MAHSHIDYLTCPMEDLPPEHVEPLRPMPPGLIRHTSHEQFMDEHNHDGWLAWQLSRPLKKTTQKRTTSVPIKKKGKKR